MGWLLKHSLQVVATCLVRSGRSCLVICHENTNKVVRWWCLACANYQLAIHPKSWLCYSFNIWSELPAVQYRAEQGRLPVPL
ncbi:hypothetical protein B0I37DRAFT_132183 [Chaetomium sp. MPI-CAGE-AT-0009]|nr:hypothetical protein B0I37DRAFT_132183 [Chaetomium sp. MPI-CAGE-AT-0009]